MLQWENDLRSIELAFSLMSKSESFERSNQANKDIKIGLELFAKHYEHLVGLSNFDTRFYRKLRH